jgi:calcineurin-like phosphoesterase family protein
MSNIWFSSDWHFHHENIVKGISKWDDKTPCRNFNSIEEHNETLIQNINLCANTNDIIYFNGDFSFGGKHNIYTFRKAINCKTIHFIYGNHDHHIRKNIEIDTDTGVVKAQSLFTSVQDILYKRIAGEKMVLCHYSMRTWDSGHHGSIMLYGHSHGSLSNYTINLKNTVNDQDGTFIKDIVYPVKFKTMDVGIDTHPKFRLYHLDDIRSEMANCIPLRIDHHNNLTN